MLSSIFVPLYGVILVFWRIQKIPVIPAEVSGANESRDPAKEVPKAQYRAFCTLLRWVPDRRSA